VRRGVRSGVTSVAFQVDQLFYRVPGGIGTYVRELVPALHRADPSLEVRLFHARFDAASPDEWMRAFPVQALGQGIRALYPWWALAGRPRLPGSLRTDVLHAPSPASAPPSRAGQRLVVTVHDLAFFRYPRAFPAAWRALFRLGVRRAARTAAALLVPSGHTADDLVRLAGADPSRIHVVPLAASLPATERDPGAELGRLGVERPYVLFVGTLEARKNLVRLIRAYRRAVASTSLPHALVLAGPRGWGIDPLERELRSSGPGRVLLTGAVPPGTLDALYRGADALIYPSLYEGFGLPVIEAMARGIPTVISTSSSLPEVAGDAALAVDPASVPALAEAIGSVLTDPGLAGRLAASGRERASAFSWDRTARQTLDVYREVL
jgi:glycosyltransferase involved in cell wall biosynthesis